mmetsp:Transcript_28124/g.71321  ORF Transcript_28124/g.71321 Transcript_28124/m.71321 type:complete len:375 (+) Transcript_28124:267-1391(+)
MRRPLREGPGPPGGGPPTTAKSRTRSSASSSSRTNTSPNSRAKSAGPAAASSSAKNKKRNRKRKSRRKRSVLFDFWSRSFLLRPAARLLGGRGASPAFYSTGAATATATSGIVLLLLHYGFIFSTRPPLVLAGPGGFRGKEPEPEDDGGVEAAGITSAGRRGSRGPEAPRPRAGGAVGILIPDTDAASGHEGGLADATRGRRRWPSAKTDETALQKQELRGHLDGAGIRSDVVGREDYDVVVVEGPAAAAPRDGDRAVVTNFLDIDIDTDGELEEAGNNTRIDDHLHHRHDEHHPRYHKKISKAAGRNSLVFVIVGLPSRLTLGWVTARLCHCVFLFSRFRRPTVTPGAHVRQTDTKPQRVHTHPQFHSCPLRV